MFRVGIVGCGRISDLHASGYRGSDDFRITAVCDVDREAAAAKARAWGAPDSTVAVYEDYRALCHSGEVDLVEALVPHHMHHPVAMYALRAGLGVSVQKPMAITLAEADGMIAEAARRGAFFKVYENFVHYPPIARARRIIDEGGIGEPLGVRIKSNPGDPAFGWRVPREAREWRHDPNRGGGGPLTFDDGHHKLAAAWFLMGRIERVYAQIGSTATRDGMTLDAPAVITFGFSGGRMGVFDVVYSPGLRIFSDNYPQDDHVEVTGSEGILWITRGHGRTVPRAPLIVYRGGVTYEYDDMPSGWEASFAASTRNTMAALRGEEPPSLTGEEGRHLLEAGLALQKSAAADRPIPIS